MLLAGIFTLILHAICDANVPTPVAMLTNSKKGLVERRLTPAANRVSIALHLTYCEK